MSLAKHNVPRRRKTLPYPSPPSSIDSVSSCDSLDSLSSTSSSLPSSPTTEPKFTELFSHEPDSRDYYSLPPPTAQFFLSDRRVSSQPKAFTKKEQWKLWYSANFGTNLLEPWENILIHLLFLSILALTYVALSRLFGALPQIGSRIRFYATGARIGGIVDKSFI